MQVMTPKMQQLVLIAIGLAVAIYANGMSANPTPIEVWRGGDDGLTARLQDQLESGFKSSSDFIVSSGKKPGTLFVTIPTNVAWKQVSGRTKVSYTVEYTFQFKTTDKQRAEIKKIREDGVSISALSRTYGISRASIMRITGEL